MALLRLFFIIFAASAALFSCGNNPSELFSYRDSPSCFTAVFPSANGDVSAYALMNPDGIVFEITEPVRSEGITIECTAVSCEVTSGETVIPLSEDASSALRDVFFVLMTESESSSVTRSSDGDKTVIELQSGTLTLDENLLPCSVECRDMSGEMRNVEIKNYTLTPEPENAG